MAKRLPYGNKGENRMNMAVKSHQFVKKLNQKRQMRKTTRHASRISKRIAFQSTNMESGVLNTNQQ